MAKLTWLGEGIHSPPELVWNDIVFPLNEGVHVVDPVMIRKAAANPRFKVEDDPPEDEAAPAAAPAEHHDDDDDDDEDDEEDDDDKPATKRAAPRAAPKPKPKQWPIRRHR